MKRILMFLLILPFFAFAQDEQNRIVVTEDVNECVQKIYDNPDAIKLLMTTIMSDRSKMQQLHRDLMNDPDFKQMMRQMQSEMRDEGMHQDMHQNPHMNQNPDIDQDPNMDTTPDTQNPDIQTPDTQTPDPQNPDINTTPEIQNPDLEPAPDTQSPDQYEGTDEDPETGNE